MFYPAYDVSHLTGAIYNPRRIDEDSLKALQESIREIGMVKPVIATDKNTIVAGHQRTKALQKMGVNQAPVFVIKQVSPEDEVLFNQLHNGTDNDSGEEMCLIAPAVDSLAKEEKRGYAYAPYQSVTGNFRAKGAEQRSETAKLLMRHGNWGACVATFSGVVLSGASYAMACHTIAMDPRVFYVPEEEAEKINYFFGLQYGVFSYDHIPKTHSLQSFAQLYRLRNPKNPKRSKSYEEWVKPTLTRDERLLDFGCGQGDYVRFLQKRGYRALGIEFFFRRGWSINKSEVRRRIDKVVEDIQENGLYDHVICDFVMNSIVDLQAEHDVLTCIGAFCKPGGTVYVSGRFKPKSEESRTARGGNSNFNIRFVDEDGFTGMIHMGGWFFQKFHTVERIAEIMAMYYNPDFERMYDSVWRTRATKKVMLPADVCEASLRREFDLPWPDGQRVNRADEIVAAWRPAYEAAYQGITPTDIDFPHQDG